MCDPLAPGRETSGRAADGFAPVEFSRRRDLDPGSPLGELSFGDGPRIVWSFRQALVETLPLFGRREFEVAHHDRRTDVRCRLPQSRPFVSTPEAEVDDDIRAELEGAHPDLDQ